MGSGTANGDWTRNAPPNATIIYKIGIYGWRKRCLYCFILLMMIMAIVNMALTIWILRVMDFSIDGMGKLRITPDGVRVEGNTEFLRAVYARHISSTPNSALYLESSKNITLNARDGSNNIVNRLLIGDKKIVSYAKKFEINSPEGKSLFSASGDGVYMGADKLTVTGVRGATFKDSITTPLVQSDLQDLSLEAPSRSLHINAQKAVNIKAPVGNINLNTFDAITISARRGIHLNSNNITMQNLVKSTPRFRGEAFETVYQLCICEKNGKLFLSPAEGNCQADRTTCS